MAKTKSALQDTYEQLENAFDCSLPDDSIEYLKKIVSGELVFNTSPGDERTFEEFIEDIRAKRGDEVAEQYIVRRELHRRLHLR